MVNETFAIAEETRSVYPALTRVAPMHRLNVGTGPKGCKKINIKQKVPLLPTNESRTALS